MKNKRFNTKNEVFESNKMEATAKISRLFEKDFVENLNKLISNPEVPMPALNLIIKQGDLKNEGFFIDFFKRVFFFNEFFLLSFFRNFFPEFFSIKTRNCTKSD